MADIKMFWGRSDKSKMFDVKVFRQRYELVEYAVKKGFTYDEFKNYCYANNHNFSVITTVMNIFGLIQLDDNKKLQKNKFLHENIEDDEFLLLYLEYFLSYWQESQDGIIVKPYLLILKVLELLKSKNESPHLSEFEFTEIFREFKSYDDINDDLIDKILIQRQNPQNNQYGNLGYSTKAYLQYSSLLSFDKKGKEKGFFLELIDSDIVNQQIDSLFSIIIRDDIFPIKLSTGKEKNTAWAKFLNNEQRFNRWKNQVFYEKDIEEVGESGLESGIESDDMEDEFITPLTLMIYLLIPKQLH